MFIDDLVYVYWAIDGLFICAMTQMWCTTDYNNHKLSINFCHRRAIGAKSKSNAFCVHYFAVKNKLSSFAHPEITSEHRRGARGRVSSRVIV